MSIEQIFNGLGSLAQLCHNQSITAKTKYAHDLWDDMDSIATEALAMLRTHPEARPNEPLTLEDTLTMHGEPAYLHWPDGGEWVLIRVVSPDREKVELVHRNGILAPIRFVFDGGGKLYRRPPKEEA